MGESGLDHSFLKRQVGKFSRKFALSDREREVFSLLVERVTNSEQIAGRLEVSRNTIRNHFQNIFHKTKTNSKTELLSSFIGDVFGDDVSGVEPLRLGPIHILYVEDDRAFGELAVRALSKANFGGTMTLVHSGAAAIDYLNREGEFSGTPNWKKPDVILLDIVMPERDGFEILAQIKEDPRYSATPVIALTSSADPVHVERVYRTGGSSLIRKPVGYKALVDLMRTISSYWVDAATVPH